MLRSRLARKLFLVVFVAIVLIELIIVFPSYNSYQSSQLANYRELARVAASAALTHHSHTDVSLRHDLEKLIAADPRFVGAAAIDNDGQAIASAGEPVAFRPTTDQSSRTELSGNNPAYDVYFPAHELDTETDIVLRMDIAPIVAELDSFLIRILALTLVICAVAGSIVFIYVVFKLIYPLEKIHESLKQAKINPIQADAKEIPTGPAE